jgi:hypothetical protein
MIFIIEVPHQRRASCWTARDKYEVVRIAQERARKSGENIDTYEQAIYYIGHDLHNFAVLESDDEAVDAFSNGQHPIFSGHQGGYAWDALKSEIEKRIVDTE